MTRRQAQDGLHPQARGRVEPDAGDGSVRRWGHGACPHCGQVIHRAPQGLVLAIDLADLPRRQRQVAEALLDRWPRYVASTDLFGMVWDDERDDPLSPEIALQSAVLRLRRALRGSGWGIESRRFSGYRFAEDKRP